MTVGLGRFDVWVTRWFLARGRPLLLRTFGWVVFLPVFIVVRFLALVAVLEVTIIAFAASIYLVWGEWLLLFLLFPITLVGRLVRALPWRVVVYSSETEWIARVRGWHRSREAALEAAHAQEGGTEPAMPPWSRTRHAARVWM
jgi:hypothetical protein